MKFGVDYGPDLVESLRKHLKNFRTASSSLLIDGGYAAAWETDSGEKILVKADSPDRLMEAIMAKLKELKEKEKPKVEPSNPYKRKLVL